MTAQENASPIEARSIPGFLGYLARSDGRVIGRRGGVLKPSPRPCDGRPYLLLSGQAGRKHKRQVGVWVLLAFVGPCPEGMQCCHNDGDFHNNMPGNLRWDTPASNTADAIRQGRHRCCRLAGEAHHMARLTDADVLEIRRIGYPLQQHAEKYGVNKTLIGKILRRENWRHLGD